MKFSLFKQLGEGRDTFRMIKHLFSYYRIVMKIPKNLFIGWVFQDIKESNRKIKKRAGQYCCIFTVSLRTKKQNSAVCFISLAEDKSSKGYLRSNLMKLLVHNAINHLPKLLVTAKQLFVVLIN